MSRTLRWVRGHGRALGIGLAAVMVSGTLLVALRDDAEPSGERKVVLREFGRPDVLDTRDAMLMAAKTANETRPAAPRVSGTEDLGAAAADAPTRASEAPESSGAIALASSSAAFDRLAVVDPLLNMEAEPVAITDLPTVESAPAAAGPAVPIYEPGSIGKAKRQWAAAAAPEEEEKRFGGLVVGTGGHCPMPGKGGGRGWPGVLWAGA